MLFKKISNKKRSIIYSWAVSYLSIILVFVIFILLIFMYSFNMYKNEVSRSNDYMMKHTREMLDRIINDTRRTANDLWLDIDIPKIFDMQKNATDEQYMSMYKIKLKLNNILSSNKAIDIISIIDVKNDRVISTQGVTDLKTFYNIVFAEQSINYETFISNFEQKKTELYFPTMYKSGDNNGAQMVNYMRSLSTFDSKDMKMCVVITVNAKHFLEQMEAINNISKGESYVISGDGTLMACSGNTMYPKIKDISLSGESGTFRHTIAGKERLISFERSKANNWIYLNVFSESQYIRNIVIFQVVFSLGFIIIITVGIFLASYFVKKNYGPIFTLLNMFERKGRQGVEQERNEFDFLSTKIKDTIEANKRKDRQISIHKHVLRDRFFERLLKGQSYDDGIPVSDALLLYDINFKWEQYAVSLYFAGDSDSSVSAGDNTYTYNQIVYIISNVVEELVSKHHNCIMVECESFIACIANISPERTAEAISDLIYAAEYAKKFIGENFEINFDVSVSSVFTGLENIHKGYNEALDVIKHKNLLGIEKTLSFIDIKDIGSSTYYYPFSLEQQFSDLIKTGNAQEARSVVDDVFNMNLKKEQFTPELAQYLVLNLTSTVIRTINELSKSLDQEFFKGKNPMDEMLSAKSIDEMKERLYYIINNVCMYIQETKQVKESWIKTDVLPYIAENYRDYNLSVSSLADKFNVHPVYVSRLFKEQMNEGLLEYINKVRIKMAKEMLISTDMTLDEIALAVGYTSSRTLSRTFKKMERVTPGKFREIS